MKIGITGVPGSGKTTLAKDLAKLYHLQYISINDIVIKHRLGKEVDVARLEKIVRKRLKGMDNFVIEGHLLVDLNTRLDKIILLRASYRALLRRYRRRNYSEWKIWENIAAEVLDYFSINLAGKKYIEINTTGLTRKMLLKKAITYLEEEYTDHVDWREDRLMLIRKGMI